MNTGKVAPHVLAHSGTLSLGEGETDAALGLDGCVGFTRDGRVDSLSQRERAGVRENGYQHRDATRKRDATLPPISPWKLRFFLAYTRRYLRRHFHAVRLLGAPALPMNRPAVIYLNHAAWWDPLVCLFLAEQLFPARPGFAPIEAAQLERYGIFRNLGFFGVEPGTARGAIRFLRTAENVLRDPAHLLWLTPQGRFADPRERPALLQEGLGRLALRARHAVFMPLAIEYPFWNDRLPEVLAHFGEPVTAEELPAPASGGEAQSRFLAARLECAQDELARASQARQPDAFTTLLGGEAGVGGVYDAWRRMKARWRGEAFSAEHGGGSVSHKLRSDAEPTPGPSQEGKGNETNGASGQGRALELTRDHSPPSEGLGVGSAFARDGVMRLRGDASS
jgi:1-acyl-sn-glycerol-3-phosphate acyltransferase